MPIYMQYGEVLGTVETKGYEKWTEINSLQWGVGRAIGSAMSSSADRESSLPTVSEITLSKEMDVASSKLLEDALAGKLNTEVKIAVCTTGKGELKEFLRYTLTNTGLSGYSLTTSGDRPSETLTLNFTKVEITYTSLNASLNGQPYSSTYDLAKATLNG